MTQCEYFSGFRCARGIQATDASNVDIRLLRNTASRIESTGKPGKIHLSAETAELLITAGKDSWVVKREDCVQAKGKGDLHTYWLVEESSTKHQLVPTLLSQSTRAPSANSSKFERLIDWNTDVLANLLSKVVAKRTNDSVDSADLHESIKREKYVIDEVQEIIDFPVARGEQPQVQQSTDLPSDVLIQLRAYVAVIAKLYRQNDFHNFEHVRQNDDHLSKFDDKTKNTHKLYFL